MLLFVFLILVSFHCLCAVNACSGRDPDIIETFVDRLIAVQREAPQFVNSCFVARSTIVYKTVHGKRLISAQSFYQYRE